ncbi:MAG: hypothetical protein RLZZ142_2384 [Verrucomicrobiota bacterium]|jgi:hypothetical protein
MRLLLSISFAWLIGGTLGKGSAPQPLPSHIQTFLENHCTDCHDNSTKKGDINLELVSVDWGAAESARLLDRVHRVLEKGEMPPPKKKRPPLSELRQTLDWIDQGLTQKTPPAATGIRRLTRAEYVSTIERSFYIGNFRLPPGFPEDTRSHGFENVAESLVISRSLMDAYSETAALIADRIFRLPRSARISHTEIPIKQMSLQDRDFGGTTTLLREEAMRFALKEGRSAPVVFEAPASGTYRLRLRAASVHPEAQPLHLKILAGGTHQILPIPSTTPTDLVVEIPIYEGKKPELELIEARRTFLTRGNIAQFREELRGHLQNDPRLLSAWLSFHEEVTPKQGKPYMRLRPSARPEGDKTDEVVQSKYLAKSLREVMASGSLVNPPPTPETLERLLDLMTSGSSWHYLYAWNLHAFETAPAIDLFALTIEGPLSPIEDPDTLAARRFRQVLLGTPPGEPGSQPWIQHSVKRIIETAFRRPSKETERSDYGKLAQEHLSSGHTPEEALNLVLRAALVSPHFLYREIHEDSSLSLYELASRLSYLLTFGPPDHVLLKAAGDGSLAQRETVRAQALRLLASPQVSGFTKSFCSQWLGTRALPLITPSPQLGTFDFRHLEGFSQEVELCFAEILRENRPLSDFIDPDFTYTNAIVARQIYGLPVPEKTKGETDRTMVRVSLPRGGRRGGLLGMAGIMMATANGVDTQPVIRGKWLLENILGDPPPPPPPSVPAITPDTRSAKTIRDLMAAHTQDEKCAGCHRKLDPPGFLLENFDALGNWRDTYPIYSVGKDGKTVTRDGPPIDAAAVFPDGTPMRDVTDLKRHVVSHIDSFASCVAEKLFLYGTGRVPNYAERKNLRLAAHRVIEQNGGFRDLLLSVLDLEDFRLR